MTGAHDANTSAGPSGKTRIFSYQEILLPVWTHRTRIISLSLIAGLLTLVINFLFLPLYYQTTATLLPETEKGNLSSLRNFVDVAQLASVDLGGNEIARLYPSIVTSETVLSSVIEREYQTERFSGPVNLMGYFELDEEGLDERMDEALKQLRGLLSATYDTKSGIATITLEMREPQLAADVTNAIVAELDKFMRLKKAGSASEQLAWIEERMHEVSQELSVAEEGLNTFREKNRRVIDSPQLLLEQERLRREVEVKSTVYIELKKQSELAKIEELKNMTIVNVLDPARAPVKKSRPKRATNTVIMFLLTLVGSSLWYSMRALYGSRVRDFFAPFQKVTWNRKK